MIASVLSTSGYTTGLYTSPHLRTWRERIRVDSRLISEEELASLVERAKSEIEAINQRAVYGQLTTFELLTVLAFAHFDQREVDFQVLEVGMGGKFDATSVINPEVCVITSISLDHTDVLGNSLAEITSEKAAIIKPGSIVVVSPQTDEAQMVIKEACVQVNAELIQVGYDVTGQSIWFDLNRQLLWVEGRLANYDLALPLLGQYQLDNAITAVAALEGLVEKGFAIDREDITEGLARASWPGRFQIIGHRPLIIVDGAHNPAAARKLKESLEQYFNFNRAILIIGASNDKDISGIASELSSFFDHVIATRSHHPRAAASESIVAEFKRHRVAVQGAGTISEALSLARSLADVGDLICVAGSLFIVAEAIDQLNPTGLLIEW
jgi:dihydrofolate synthase/folylpolyglutamate synthase